MKSINKNLFFAFLAVMSLFASSCVTFDAEASRKSTARKVIQKTAYVINEAYEMVNYYDSWSGSSLSKAVYYNNYAQSLFSRRRYDRAVNYSLLAREYAVDVINNCDNYWDYFFYTYFGWSYAYGYNAGYNAGYANGYRDGYYDAYYRAYCNRYDHYDSHYNPHGGNHHRNPSDYNQPTLSSGSAHGRGTNSSIGSGSSNGTTGRLNGGSNGAIFKELSQKQYFDDSELKLMKELPSETTLESEFKQANPTKTFDDKALAKDVTALSANKTISNDFKPASSKDNVKFELAEPKKINATTNLKQPATQTPNTDTKVVTPVKEIKQPVRNETPVLKDNPPTQKPVTKQPVQTTTPSKQTTTPSKQVTNPAKPKPLIVKQNPTPSKQTTTQQPARKAESNQKQTTVKKQSEPVKSKSVSTKSASVQTKSQSTTTKSTNTTTKSTSLKRR
ncbi:MAG: hypothetical protein LBL74_01975 [Bacteroidales bacterium]|jgi:hypothetical protein|nr:hypothetical protein [Bacteroidales bacterium]